MAISGPQGELDAKQLGATGDGTTDDTSAIQAALDTGKDVFLPKGDYSVSNLTLTANGQRLYGSGYNSKLIGRLTNGSSILTVNGFDFFTIENLSIWGTGSGTTPVNLQGLEITSANRWSLRNVTIRNCAVGWDATEAFIASIENLFIKYCTLGFQSISGFNSIAGTIMIEDVAQGFTINGASGCRLFILLEGATARTSASLIDDMRSSSITMYTEEATGSQSVAEIKFGATTYCYSVDLTLSGDLSDSDVHLIELDRVDGFRLHSAYSKGTDRRFLATTANTRNVELLSTDLSLTNKQPTVPGSLLFEAPRNYFRDGRFRIAIPSPLSNANQTPTTETTVVPPWSTISMKATATVGTNQNNSAHVIYIAGTPYEELLGTKVGVGYWVYCPDSGFYAMNTAGPDCLFTPNGTGATGSGVNNTRFVLDEWIFVTSEIFVPSDATQITIQFFSNRSATTATADTYCYFGGVQIWNGGLAVSHKVQNGLAASHPQTQTGVYSGSGTPESAVTAPVGTLYLRTDGSTSTTLYVKETGTGNTGWVAK